MSDWFENPFIERTMPEVPVPWQSVGGRWGHSLHSMCSYQGTFPARLARYFVHAYSAPGDLVMDPFSGKGTTLVEACLLGRRVIASDLSPLAFALSRAKAAPPSFPEVQVALASLRSDYDVTKGSWTGGISDDIAMLFHEASLDQICFLRERLVPNIATSDLDAFLVGCLLGIMHGGGRVDGSSSYLSLDMPNTFSMSPDYVRRFVQQHHLIPPKQDVFDRLEEKAARMHLDAMPSQEGRVLSGDAVDVMSRPDIRAKVDLILTSPPYLGVVNYASANWIRLWLLGMEDVARQRGEGRRFLDARLDHGHAYPEYAQFMRRVFVAAGLALRPGGVAAIVIGDVAENGNSPVELADRVWKDVGVGSGLLLTEMVADPVPANQKVSRIWGDTKGRATDRDCILILRAGATDGSESFRADDQTGLWDEMSYKDAGPDAAHTLVAKVRAAARH